MPHRPENEGEPNDNGIEIIDVRMHGIEEVTAAYLVRGERATAIVDCGPASSFESTLSAIETAGIEAVDWIVLTHIHFDHAGAAGHLAECFPQASVAVHPRGARHLVDPTRLWKGVQAVYGARTEELWGRPLAIGSERVRSVSDGGKIELGGRSLLAIETPGHAPHHHSWLDTASQDIFAGDAIGMQVGRHELWRPTTPPPDFNLAQSLESIKRLRALARGQILLGHFGPATHHGETRRPDIVLDQCERLLREWVSEIEIVHRSGTPPEDVERTVRDWLDRRELMWPTEARRLLDGTSDVSLDLSGVTHWLDRDGEG